MDIHKPTNRKKIKKKNYRVTKVTGLNGFPASFFALTPKKSQNSSPFFMQELMELSDRIGYVDGGLQEDEILECLKRPKKSFIKSVDFNSKVKDSKCSICQVSTYYI